MTGSSYISVPEPGSNSPSIAAAVLALKHNVNQLIVNSNALSTQRNLSGSKIFALQDLVQNLSNTVNGAPGSGQGLVAQVAANSSGVSGHDNNIQSINQELASIQTQINSINTLIMTINTEITTINTQITTINTQITTINTQIAALQALILSPRIVSALPAAAGNQGVRGLVTDATVTLTAGIGTIVAGTGANIVPVFSDGTNWIIG